MPKVEIVSFDSHGPELPSGEAGVEIRDLEDPQNCSYCIIFRQIGSDPKEPSSWEYYYANHWNLAEEQAEEQKDPDHPGRYEPKPVSREEIEKFLAKHNSSSGEVLGEYCQKLKERGI